MNIAPSLRWIAPLLALPLAVLTPGCDGDSPTAPTLPEGDVAWETLIAVQNSGIRMFRREVVREDLGYEALWDEVGTDSDPPPVDFNVDMVVGVASGAQPRSCFSVEVTRAISDGTDLTLTVTETIPNPDCLCAEVVVEPVEVIRLPRANEVTFNNVTVEDTCDA